MTIQFFPKLMPAKATRGPGRPLFQGLLFLLFLIVSISAACGGGRTSAPDTSANLEFPKFSTAGPFATTFVDVSNCTIFRPSNLGAEGTTYPVILWGNGTSTQVAIYQGLLSHLASHGFIVAAADTSNAGDGSQMLDGLTYLTAQNATPGSPFYHHVDLQHVGASGHSQGGAGAIMAGRDPRVTTTVPLQPYILPISGGGRFLTASIGQQQGPMFLVSGGADSTAVPDTHQRPVFNGANTSVVWATLAGADHYAPFGDAGRFRGPATAWFRARLMGDAEAAQLFPPVCMLCGTSGWTVVSK